MVYLYSFYEPLYCLFMPNLFTSSYPGVYFGAPLSLFFFIIFY